MCVCVRRSYCNVRIVCAGAREHIHRASKIINGKITSTYTLPRSINIISDSASATSSVPSILRGAQRRKSTPDTRSIVNSTVRLCSSLHGYIYNFIHFSLLLPLPLFLSCSVNFFSSFADGNSIIHICIHRMVADGRHKRRKKVESILSLVQGSSMTSMLRET